MNNYKKFALMGFIYRCLQRPLAGVVHCPTEDDSASSNISGCHRAWSGAGRFLGSPESERDNNSRQGKNTSKLSDGGRCAGHPGCTELPRKHLFRRWDLTEDKQNSLAQESLQILEKLPSKVSVVGYFSPRMSKEAATQLLENYKSSSNGKFDYKFVDPDARSVAAKAAHIPAMVLWYYTWTDIQNRSPIG
jgi:hypothetical protein